MSVIERVVQEYKANIDPTYIEICKQFTKKGDLNKYKNIGVRTPIRRKISAKYFKEIKHLSKEEILKLCEQLWEIHPSYSTVAIDWAFRIRKRFEEPDFDRFEDWIRKYVHSWGRCDDLCGHIIQYFIQNFPQVIPRIKKWAKSENMWFRRASAVGFITTYKQYYAVTHNLKDIFEIAETLLKDKEDLVQKGYGWMLKAASVVKQKEVFEFVMKHKHEMPRTALRYAIEKMPKDLKTTAMHKG